MSMSTSFVNNNNNMLYIPFTRGQTFVLVTNMFIIIMLINTKQHMLLLLK